MESKLLYELKRDEDCYLVIHLYKDGRKSSRINCTWSGLVDQFKNKTTTVRQVKKAAIKWLEKNLNQEHDPEFSSKKDYEWLLKNLNNEITN